MEIISYTFKNPVLNYPIYSKQDYLIEIVVFLLAEQVVLGPTAVVEFHGGMLDYVLTIIDPLDIPSANLIMDEINEKVAAITEDRIYQSLLSTGEVFLKYDYTITNKFSKIQFYSIGGGIDPIA